MRGRLVYPFSEELLAYEFSPTHPLKPDRLRLTYELSERMGLLDEVRLVQPVPATRDELEMFHSPDFVDAVMDSSNSSRIDAYHGLGTADNPVFPGIYEAATKYVGATLDGAREIVKGASNAFVISGGLHHAQRSEASGFCIFNDVVLAIMLIQKKTPCRVLYYDFDAHHGDGVQNAFYRSKDVLTISTHQTGKTLFPGTGFVYETGGGEGTGYSVNIPLLPGSGSPELIKSFEEVVVPLFESYRPDLLVTQLGVDGHYMDPLANLAFTTHGYEHVLTRLRDLSNSICRLGWLALGGGGYHILNVARLWTLFLAIMLDRKVDEQLPMDMVEACSKMHQRCPTTMRDHDRVVQMYLDRAEVELDLERTLRRVKELVFPYHGLA
ncbi:MAG: acetoin utilization protein AcuC [Candidatus Thorarchaeota archaeon]|nr:acetoin utilization protein AcuC [Candidatus Thorarchaeota archaeon]